MKKLMKLLNEDLERVTSEMEICKEDILYRDNYAKYNRYLGQKELIEALIYTLPTLILEGDEK